MFSISLKGGGTVRVSLGIRYNPLRIATLDFAFSDTAKNESILVLFLIAVRGAPGAESLEERKVVRASE